MSNRKPHYEAVHNVLRMLVILEQAAGRMATYAYLADRLGVAEKTISRYAETLANFDHPRLGGPLLVVDGSASPTVVRITGHRLPHEERHVYRYAALVAATRMLTSGTGASMRGCAEEVVELFESTLCGRARAFTRRIDKVFHYIPFSPKDLRLADEVIDDLLHAAIYRRVVRVTRRTRWGAEVRERLEPFSLVMYRDGLYLLARRADGDDGTLRTYALERFDEAEVDRGSTFEVPSDFDPETHFEGRLGIWAPAAAAVRIELAFNALAADVLAPRRWPCPHSWRNADNDRSVLELELPITPELVSWILSWGPQAEVLGPTELREAVKEELQQSMERYQ